MIPSQIMITISSPVPSQLIPPPPSSSSLLLPPPPLSPHKNLPTSSLQPLYFSPSHFHIFPLLQHPNVYHPPPPTRYQHHSIFISLLPFFVCLRMSQYGCMGSSTRHILISSPLTTICKDVLVSKLSVVHT